MVILKIFKALLLGGILSLILSGCDFPSRFLAQVGREWNALKILLKGGSSPLAHSPVQPSYSIAHQELVAEAYRVVFLKDPHSTQLLDWVNALDQGASLEGLYNGFTHSSEYRALETAAKPASLEALRSFSEILTGLEKELPVPTVFDATWARPLKTILPPGPQDANQDANEDAHPDNQIRDSQGHQRDQYGNIAAAPGDAIPQNFMKVFEGASLFTLKRVLGDEALKVVATQMQDRQKLASWYSQWVPQMLVWKTDFGLELRNRSDESFHYRWVLGTSEDRVKWEILNRIHRVLNAKQ